MTHRAPAQEGPDLRRGHIAPSPQTRGHDDRERLAPPGSIAVEHSCLGRPLHWPGLRRPRLAGFQVSTEGLTFGAAVQHVLHSRRRLRIFNIAMDALLALSIVLIFC